MRRLGLPAPTSTTPDSRTLVALLSLVLVGVPDAASAAPTLTLEEAVTTALRDHPTVTVARARIGEASGRLVGAETYPYNPELELEGGARVGSGQASGDFEVGLAQEIELGGQQGRREAVGEADLRAARADARGEMRRLVAAVHLAFADALEARAQLEVAQDEAALAGELLELARRRLQAGAGTQLDVNVASAELGRAELMVGAAIGALAEARAALAERLALPPGELPMPAGELAPEDGPIAPVAELIAAAQDNREDLRALAALEAAARARGELARAGAWPNLRVGVYAGREGGAETLIGARLSIPLPVVSRNQGGVAEADAALTRTRAERRAARLRVTREVVSAAERYRAELAALKALKERVVGTTAENLALLKKAFEAGKSDWTDVLVMQRALFDARRALVATSAQARRDRLRLDVAAGTLAVPTADGEETR